jgi:alpha-tubulin suppressor-like RCC1 family protein
VGALTTWAKVSTGRSHALAVKTDGTLWSWGRNNAGQLGLNSNPVVSKSSPEQVGSLTNWSKVSAGGAHTAAIKTDGTLWAWGNGQGGTIGDGTVYSKSSPVQIGALTDWANIATGNGNTVAIKTTGTLWSWGYNTVGQLGQNNTIARSSPTQVGVLSAWSTVSAGVSGAGTTNNTLAIYQGVTN